MAAHAQVLRDAIIPSIFIFRKGERVKIDAVARIEEKIWCREEKMQWKEGRHSPNRWTSPLNLSEILPIKDFVQQDILLF